MSDPTQKFWRTMVRVVLIDDAQVYFVAPAWNSNIIVPVPRTEAPAGLKAGERYFVEANIGALCTKNLKFRNWEKTVFEIPQKLQDAFAKQDEIEPTRSILLRCYEFIKADLYPDNPDGNDLDYWHDELVDLCNLVSRLPEDDMNVENLECGLCKGTGKSSRWDHIPKMAADPCDWCEGEKGFDHPLENHKMRLWLNLLKLLSNDKGWFAWLESNTNWKRSDSHGLCLWGEWGYIDYGIKFSDVDKYDGVKCGKKVPHFPKVYYPWSETSS